MTAEERLELIGALTESIEKDNQRRLTDSFPLRDAAAPILKGKKPDLTEFQKMSVDERIELIGDIWDSIPAEAMPPLTQAQEKELERRIADYRQNPSSSLPWEVVKAELQKRLST